MRKIIDEADIDAAIPGWRSMGAQQLQMRISQEFGTRYDEDPEAPAWYDRGTDRSRQRLEAQRQRVGLK